MIWLLGCVQPVPEQFAAAGCQSDHAPVVGHTLSRAERVDLFHEEQLAVAALVPIQDGCWPALVLVPPGLEAGLPELDQAVAGELASAGVVVVAYDPRGRGQSSGQEDFGGAAHADDLRAVLRWTSHRDDVDPTRVVVRSRSYGITAAAQAVTDVPVRALVDLEGPGRLPEDLEHAPDQSRDTLTQAAQGQPWWDERSPHRWLGSYTGHYRRIQAVSDHATDLWLGHAHTLLNAASFGLEERVDLNGVERASWTYEQVERDALEGRVKQDDPRAVELLLEVL